MNWSPESTSPTHWARIILSKLWGAITPAELAILVIMQANQFLSMFDWETVTTDFRIFGVNQSRIELNMISCTWGKQALWEIQLYKCIYIKFIIDWYTLYMIIVKHLVNWSIWGIYDWLETDLWSITLQFLFHWSV